MLGYFVGFIRRQGEVYAGSKRSSLISLAAALISACIFGGFSPAAVAAATESTALAGTWTGALGSVAT